MHFNANKDRLSEQTALYVRAGLDDGLRTPSERVAKLDTKEVSPRETERRREFPS